MMSSLCFSFSFLMRLFSELKTLKFNPIYPFYHKQRSSRKCQRDRRNEDSGASLIEWAHISRRKQSHRSSHYERRSPNDAPFGKFLLERYVQFSLHGDLLSYDSCRPGYSSGHVSTRSSRILINIHEVNDIAQSGSYSEIPQDYDVLLVCLLHLPQHAPNFDHYRIPVAVNVLPEYERLLKSLFHVPSKSHGSRDRVQKVPEFQKKFAFSLFFFKFTIFRIK